MTDPETSDLRSDLFDLSREELGRLRTLDGTVLDEILAQVLAHDGSGCGPDVSAFNSAI